MFTALAAGSGHTCGLSTAGTILCWGQNAHGQLGDGSKAQSPVPVAVAASVAFGQLTVGGLHSCGLSRAGDAFCWGRNNYGQLGDGTTQDRSRPVAVEGGIRFGSIQANGAHTCGTVAGAATGYCWGFNLSGQLGNGTRSNQSRPVAAGRPR
jgi:alpha-tubulin suppressor-like RCC1 family protein